MPRFPTVSARRRFTRTRRHAAAGSAVFAAAALALAGVQSGGAPAAAADSAARNARTPAAADSAARHTQPPVARPAGSTRPQADSRAAARPSAATRPGATPSHTAAARPGGTPQRIARQMIADDAQFQCFSRIVAHESGWQVTATNPASGSYGLVQALPASKMASAGADWRTNPATQIAWGLHYMNGRYGSPCGAWSFWQAHRWY